MIADLALLAKAFPQRQRNLANMHHLFHRRANECGETFPLRLPDDPEPATKITRSVHHRILRKRIANLRQRMIQGTVTRDNSGERTRLACRFWRPAKTNFQSTTALFDIHRQIANRSDKSV